MAYWESRGEREREREREREDALPLPKDALVKARCNGKNKIYIKQ